MSVRKLEGRVGLVTGAGRGIGREVAIGLASEGAKVVVNDLDADVAQDVVREILERGGAAEPCAGSVADPDFARRFVGVAQSRFGDVHIIVNNAGYTWDAVIQKMSDEQFDAMVDVHLKAPWRILREAAEHIRVKSKEEAAQGREVVRKIVNVSSIAGTRGNPGQTNYSAAKAGVVGLTKTLSKEWGRYKTTVNCVAFGLIETRLTEATNEKREIEVDGVRAPVGIPIDAIRAMEAAIPLGRAGTPREAGGAVLCLCFPEADYISGQVIEVTGGW